MNARGLKRLAVGLPNDVFVTPTAAYTIVGDIMHERLLVIGVATSTITLPLATGSGQYLTIALGSSAAGTTNIIQRALTADRFHGSIFLGVHNAATGRLFQADQVSNANTITFNGGTQGGVSEGDIITLWDKASGVWYVQGTVTSTATPATPFSNT